MSTPISELVTLRDQMEVFYITYKEQLAEVVAKIADIDINSPDAKEKYNALIDERNEIAKKTDTFLALLNEYNTKAKDVSILDVFNRGTITVSVKKIQENMIAVTELTKNSLLTVRRSIEAAQPASETNKSASPGQQQSPEKQATPSDDTGGQNRTVTSGSTGSKPNGGVSGKAGSSTAGVW